MKLNVFTDGGARGNPGYAGIGFIIIDNETGKVVKSFKKKIGIATNNVAEYTAVLEAIKWISENYLSSELSIQFFSDSQLVVNQLKGNYKIKNFNLKKFVLKIKELEKEIKGNIFYQLISREKNRQADQLVNQALDSL